jgi:hypothetical protein
MYGQEYKRANTTVLKHMLILNTPAQNALIVVLSIKPKIETTNVVADLKHIGIDWVL